MPSISSSNDLDIVLHLDGAELPKARHIERMSSGSNIVNISIPVNIPRTNTAKKHSLSVKIKAQSSISIASGNLNMTLSGNGIKTNMEYIEVADLNEDENIAV